MNSEYIGVTVGPEANGAEPAWVSFRAAYQNRVSLPRGMRESVSVTARIRLGL